MLTKGERQRCFVLGIYVSWVWVEGRSLVEEEGEVSLRVEGTEGELRLLGKLENVELFGQLVLVQLWDDLVQVSRVFSVDPQLSIR